MAIRGSKPQATVLKLVRGNPGKRRLPKNEPMPSGNPAPPIALDGRPADLWETFVKSAWWLTAADSQKAFMYVHLAAEFEAAPAAMNAARIAQLRALGSELGFDTASRARLGATQKPVEDSLSEFFND